MKRVKKIILADESNEKPSVSSESLTNESQLKDVKAVQQRNRRKSHSQLKIPQNLSSSSTSSSSSSSLAPSASPSVRTILNLIDSLVDEKQFESSDENLLSTIDGLINSLKHLREKVKTINHDDTHPLNLSKPKIQQQTRDDRNSPATSINFPLAPALFSTQPFFSPFSGKIFLNYEILYVRFYLLLHY